MDTKETKVIWSGSCEMFIFEQRPVGLHLYQVHAGWPISKKMHRGSNSSWKNKNEPRKLNLMKHNERNYQGHYKLE